jgi:UDP-glucuronate 4-epimerase
MALSLFTQAILNGEPIRVYNYGRMRRDFTYVDDIVEGVLRVLERPPSTESTPYKIFNIGNNKPVELLDFIACLEEALGKRASKEFLPLQDGDVPETYADTQALNQWVGYVPTTEITQGIGKYVDWYRSYYGV